MEMRRRELAAFLAFAALSPISLRAQPKTPRHIGVLMSYSQQPNPALGLKRGLEELGYVEGRDIVIEWRSARGDADRYPKLTRELLDAKVELIVAGTNPAIAAARSATRSIPIVMTVASDPIRTGFVANLSRPGGNVTGVSIQSDEIAIKRVQLLKELFPRTTHVPLIWAANEAGRAESEKAFELAAQELKLQIRSYPVRHPAELEEVFKGLRKQRADAAILVGATMFFSRRAMIAELAIKHHVAILGSTRAYADAGALFSYGANFEDAYRRAASYVDKILKGARPGDLPVDQPTKFELIVNLKTAKAQGIKIPGAMLARADEILQ